MTLAHSQTSPLIRVADLVRVASNERHLRDGVAVGIVVRLIRGAYVKADVWAALTHLERYLLRIEAVCKSSAGQVVLSHQSAAAVWGYSTLAAWPKRVHIIVGSSSGQRSSPAVVRHVVDVDDSELVMMNGYLVTSPLRTLCDLARSVPFADGVVSFDRGLHSGPLADSARGALDREEILDFLRRERGARGVRTAIAAAKFADGRSDSGGETFGRVQFHRLRMPPPDLQVKVVDLEGREWHCDYGWEECLGEFDGLFKYTRGEHTKGQPPAQIVVREKRREDAIRAASKRGMLRVVWDEVSNLGTLERMMRAAGLRPVNER